MSTRTLIRRWCAHNRQYYTPGTAKIYSGVIWRAAQFLPEDIRHITAEHIERYIGHLLDAGMKRRTVNCHIGTIKSFCRWLSENYDLKNPSEKIKILKPDPPKRRFVSPEEYETILSVCSEDESKVIKLLSHTGLRASELQSLRESNVHGKSIRFTGKGRKERSVPLNQTAYQCIYIDGKPHLDFLKSYRGPNALGNLCVRLSKRAGLDSVVSPHSFRRFFGKSLLNKGVGIYPIKELYGHADIRTTEIYLCCSGDDLQGVTDVLD